MPRIATPIDARAGDWLSLGPAARRLGVDPDTLRRWADGGRLRAYATPGGHRRFARADVERLVAQRRAAPRPLSSLGATVDRFGRVYARAYANEPPASRPGELGPELREAFRADGRRLIAVILAYLDARRPHDRDRWAADAMAIIGDLGGRLAAAGVPLPDVIAAFLRARRPLLAELAALGRRRALDAAALGGLYEQAIDLLDRLQLHLVDAHATGTSQGTRTWT